ncbi:MAG: alanine--tRNA ligase [Candidatus Bathyarchaeia archaeon]
MGTSIYDIALFNRRGFVRKICRSCGKAFWTLNHEKDLCGDQPCVEYEFIGKPPVRKEFTLGSLRESFLSFFEREGHKRIRRYPVVARWREDVYLVGASIYDFQPWVTEGLVPPPANPLTISQPCIRLTDLENVGRTGRHLTSFEMMAHHAFNFPERQVYWINETVDYCYRFYVEELGIPEERITFKEDFWKGGGNAGEDLEVLIDGLEVATLVFMHYATVNDTLQPLQNRIVDTGYGLERNLWLLRASPNVYEALYGDLVERFARSAGLPKVEERILREVSKVAGFVDVRSPKDLRNSIARRIGIEAEELEAILKPYEALYAILDHTRTLLWMLGDGVVPSNMGAGYIARLLLRRSLRFMETLRIPLTLREIMEAHIKASYQDFPEFKEVAEKILEILELEEKRYKQSLIKGIELLKRRAKELKSKGINTISTEDLIFFYDSHGVPPEILREQAGRLGLEIKVPEGFYSTLAKRHERVQRLAKATDAYRSRLLQELLGLPETQLLYYDDSYLRTFKAKVLKVIDGRYAVLDRTAFYPEGGGQLCDNGRLKFRNHEALVKDVQNIGGFVLHGLEGTMPEAGDEVIGEVEWKRREQLMRHHTAAHILNAAARHVLGRHVWQTGAEKAVEKARLDISHFKRISPEELRRIEELANEVVLRNLNVRISFMPREKAEERYGFILYQGGVFPGKTIRVVEIEGWDAEACGGLHCSSTGLVGFIKILSAERIQDGVERLTFAAGEAALRYVQRMEDLIRETAEALHVPEEGLPRAVVEMVSDLKALRSEAERLKDRLIESQVESMLKEAESLGDVRLLIKFMEGADADASFAVKIANTLVNKDRGLAAIFFVLGKTVQVVVMVGDEAQKKGLHAGKIVALIADRAGGGGGGTPRLGQGGGLERDKVQETAGYLREVISGWVKVT